jgi:ribonuclease PH
MMNTGILECDFKLPPWSPPLGREKGSGSNVMQQYERQVSQEILDAIESSVLLDRYPKAVISINVVMLQSSGCEIAAAITAVSLALVDAGIEVKDIVTACSVLRTGSKEKDEGQGFIWLDPTDEEISSADKEDKCVLTVAAMTTLKELTTTNTVGRFSQQVLADMLSSGLEGCSALRRTLAQKLTTRTFKPMPSNQQL